MYHLARYGLPTFIDASWTPILRTTSFTGIHVTDPPRSTTPGPTLSTKSGARLQHPQALASAAVSAGLLRRRLNFMAAKLSAPSYRRYLLASLPGLVGLVVTAFVQIGSSSEILVWTPVEAIIWILLFAAGAGWTGIREIRFARQRLREISKADENRRAISAIGMAASWDLDLLRLYARVSQDLKSILEYDRFTITSALPTGRMRMEFVSGDADEGPSVGAILPEAPREPDGLFSEYHSKYGARLTATIPACNGTLTIRRIGSASYSSVDLDLLRQAVAQISPGIANAVMFQSSERRLRERTVLANIGRIATSSLDIQKIIDEVDASLARLIDYDHLGVILVDEHDEELGTGVLAHWSKPGLSGWHSGDEVRVDFRSVGQGTVVSRSGWDYSPLEDPGPVEDDTPRTWLQAPLSVQDHLIGTLVLSSESPDALGQDESSLLLNVSLLIAPAIQNANLTARLKRQSDERRAIAAIGLAANSDLDLDVIYRRMADELEKVLHFDRMTITHVRPEDGLHEIAYTTGIGAEGFGIGDVVKLPDMRVESLHRDARGWANAMPEVKQLVEQSGLKSRVAVPLGAAPNIFGQMSIASLEENAYDAQDLDLLERIGIQVTPAIKNARTIAAERELRETLDRQNQELAEANNARKQFLSSVSHELKTPLTIISGFIDLLASPEGVENESERQETFAIIRKNADHLNVLINDILDISRMEAGTFKINPVPFSVNELVSDLEASFQSLLRTKTQTLIVEMADDELWIRADRSRISQVATNILSNASKYSPDSTEITLRCHVDGDRLHLAVSDQGAGMSPEEQKGLFTPFFRADNETTRKVSGTGLGLMIAKSITELHGGEIRLESRVGAGTTVEFWLPGLTTREVAEQERPEEQQFTGSRLWPNEPDEDIELGAD